MHSELNARNATANGYHPRALSLDHPFFSPFFSFDTIRFSAAARLIVRAERKLEKKTVRQWRETTSDDAQRDILFLSTGFVLLS